jgi:hypothetical protein
MCAIGGVCMCVCVCECVAASEFLLSCFICLCVIFLSLSSASVACVTHLSWFSWLHPRFNLCLPLPSLTASPTLR